MPTVWFMCTVSALDTSLELMVLDVDLWTQGLTVCMEGILGYKCYTQLQFLGSVHEFLGGRLETLLSAMHVTIASTCNSTLFS